MTESVPYASAENNKAATIFQRRCSGSAVIASALWTITKSTRQSRFKHRGVAMQLHASAKAGNNAV